MRVRPILTFDASFHHQLGSASSQKQRSSLPPNVGAPWSCTPLLGHFLTSCLILSLLIHGLTWFLTTNEYWDDFSMQWWFLTQKSHLQAVIVNSELIPANKNQKKSAFIFPVRLITSYFSQQSVTLWIDIVNICSSLALTISFYIPIKSSLISKFFHLIANIHKYVEQHRSEVSPPWSLGATSLQIKHFGSLLKFEIFQIITIFWTHW